MAERLKWGAVIAAVLWGAPTVMAQPGMQCIAGRDLAGSGVTRLSDLFTLAKSWEGTSTDGYHWDVAPIGAGQPETWKLFVDHIPADVRAIGRHRLNLLPLSISEICEVRFYSRPTVIGGTTALSGAVHILTCSPGQGWTAQGLVAATNETGDPGPWRYTPWSGPNVDRSGPTVHASVTKAASRAHIRIQAGMDEHHVTDPRIRTRVHTLYRGDKDARIQPRFARLDADLGHHRLTFASSRSRDFLYSILFGLEAPVDHDIQHVSLSGRMRPAQYYLRTSRNRIATRTNPENLNVDFDHMTAGGQVRLVPAFGNPNLSLGLLGTLTHARFQPGIPVRTFFQGKAFGEWTPRASSLLNPIFYGAVRLDGNVPGITALATATLDAPRIDLTLVVSNRAHTALKDFSYWLRQGYSPGRPIAFAGSRSRTTLLSLDMSWRYPGRRIDLQFIGGLRHHSGLQFLNTIARFDSASTSLLSSGQVDYVSGQVGRIAVHAQANLFGHVSTVVHAAFALPFQAQTEYYSHWKHRMLLHASASYAPNQRLSLRMLMRVRGASQWPAYEEVAHDGAAHYTDYLSPGVFMDLTIRKRLWRDHLDLSATLRNLLDHDHLHHPAGGRSRLSFHLRLAWAFHSALGLTTDSG